METELNQIIDKSLIRQSFSYEQFLELVEKLYEAGKTTNGDNTDAMLDYTKLSLQRLKRITKSGKLEKEYAEVYASNRRKMNWLVLNEGWCGDSGQILPFIAKIAEAAPGVELSIVLRDHHPELMDLFLTNGTRSIPKVIIQDAESGEVIGLWGPRPAEAQDLFLSLKKDENISGAERTKQLHTWYAKNKGKEIQREFAELFQSLNQ
jgi:hypothetical protein